MDHGSSVSIYILGFFFHRFSPLWKRLRHSVMMRACGKYMLCLGLSMVLSVPTFELRLRMFSTYEILPSSIAVMKWTKSSARVEVEVYRNRVNDFSCGSKSLGKGRIPRSCSKSRGPVCIDSESFVELEDTVHTQQVHCRASLSLLSYLLSAICIFP